MEIQMKSKSYDFLNAFVRIILPGLGALYFALSMIWLSLPYALEIVGSISAITIFGGLVVQLAKNGWKAEDDLLIYKGDEFTSFGFASGQLMENLEPNQTLVLHVKEVDDNPFDA